MITISLCMIVKDEEETLARCLQSVGGVADEIIIVDTGSTDATKEVAARFTDKIYDFTWVDDFAAARNFSFDQAQMDYILWLDADDVLLPEDALKLKKLKDDLSPDIGAVMMRYNTGFDKDGRVTFSFFRERLVKRSVNCRWQEPVHEYLDGTGKRINIDICVTHAKTKHKTSERNLRIYEKTLAAGKELSPRGMYYFARELKDHQRFEEAIQWFKKFMDSGLGWVEDNITACSETAKCYLALNKHQEALESMFYSFFYDNPRAEACCQIGYFFKAQTKYKQALFWFELALQLKKDPHNWGFCWEDCWGYIPCIELAVCYDKLGDHTKAAQYNERAAIYKPDSPAILYNRKYFAGKNADHDT